MREDEVKLYLMGVGTLVRRRLKREVRQCAAMCGAIRMAGVSSVFTSRPMACAAVELARDADGDRGRSQSTSAADERRRRETTRDEQTSRQVDE